MRNKEDAGPPVMDESTLPAISDEEVRRTRELAHRWATDDAEYELFTTMLLGDEQ